MGKPEEMKQSFIIISIWLLFGVTNGFATTIKVVNTPNSIHNAILKAQNGDTLLLQKGLYKEHDIIIQKRLTIIGNDFPVIDAEMGLSGLFLVRPFGSGILQWCVSFHAFRLPSLRKAKAATCS